MDINTSDIKDPGPQKLIPDEPDYKPEYIETKYGIADQDLKKLGFLTAVEYPDDPYPRYEELLLNHKIALDNIRGNSLRIADIQKDKYNALLDKGAARHAEIEREMGTYSAEVSEHEHEHRELASSLQQVKDKIYEVYLSLAARKKNFASERIDEVTADLRKMMDSQSSLYDDKDGYFKGYANTGRQIAEQTLERVRKITASFEKRYDEIQLFIQCFDKHGVSALSHGLLIAVGWSAALIAGLFFAAAFDDRGAANLLDDLLQSGLQFVNSYSHWWGLGLLVTLIGVLSMVIVVIDYMMRLYKRWLLRKKLDRILPRDKEAFSFSTNGDNAFGLNMSIKADSWWYFWLQVLPFILIIACIVFLLSYKYDGKSGKPVYDLGKATMGMVIALASAGLMYIVIGRRFRNECAPPDGRAPEKTWWTGEWELRFVVFLLLGWDLLMIVLYVLYATGQIDLTSHWKNFVALSEFILVTVMCAVALSYGLYLRSMTDLATELEEYLHRLHSLHWEYYASVPSLYYANVFGKTFRELHLEMLTAIGKKVNPYFPIPERSVGKLREKVNRMINAVLRRNENLENEKSALDRFLDALKFWKSKDKAPAPEVPMQYKLDEDDKILFPDLNEQIGALEKEKLDIEKRLQVLEAEITQYKLHKSERYTILARQAELLTEQINGWRNAIVEIDQRLLMELKHMRRQRIKEQVILMDGFHLGMWHRENDMGPAKGFFTDKKVSV